MSHHEQRTEETRDDWATPQWLFDMFDDEFGFQLDVCANPDTAKCDRFFTPEDDGLSQDWGENTCWMNPPYGSAIPGWLAKAVIAQRGGARVVALVPARTDTRWFHNIVLPNATEVRLAKGRVSFLLDGVPFDQPGFGSMIVVFNGPSRDGPRFSAFSRQEELL